MQLHHTKETLSYWKMFNSTTLSTVSYLLFYILGVYLANVLKSPDDFGNYSVTVSTILLMSSLMLFGHNLYILRIYPEYLKEKRLDYIHGYLRRISQIITISSIIIAIITMISYEIYLKLSNPEHHHPIVVGILFTPICALTLLFLEVLNVNQKYYLSIFIRRVFLPILMGFFIFMFVRFRYANATSAIIALGIAWTLSFFINLVSLKEIRPIFKSSPQYDTKKWFMESFPYLFYLLVISGGNMLGIIMIEIIHPIEGTVGIFAAAFQTANFITLPNSSSTSYILPIISGAFSDQKKIKLILSKRRNFILMSTSLYFLVIIIFGKYFLSLFGAEYAANYNTLIVLSLAFFVQALFGVLTYLLQYYGLVKQMIRALIIYMGSGLILYSALIPFFHGLGAAIAFLLSTLILIAYQTWLLYCRTHMCLF